MTKQTILTLAAAMLTAMTVNAHELSSRAYVGTGDNVMIGGIIVQDLDCRCSDCDDDTIRAASFVIRVLGPSLTAAGVSNVLADPQLAFYDEQGNLIGGQNDYTENDIATQEMLAAHGLAPSDVREVAFFVKILPGFYTAIVSGVGETTGVAILEAYKL